MAEDQEKIERIKSNLRSYLNEQPTGEHAEQAKRILVNLQANAASMPSPSRQMKTPSDEELGIENQPIEGSRVMDMGAQTARAQPGMDAEATMPKRDLAQAHRMSQGEMTDPIVSELGSQAAGMSLLHLAGMGMSGIGRQLLKTKAGQAAKFLADQGAPAAAPRGASFLEPSPEFDPMGYLAKAREAVALKPPHTVMHLGSLGALLAPSELAARNVAPLAGRAALPLIRAGAGASTSNAALLGSPLLQAATRGE